MTVIIVADEVLAQQELSWLMNEHSQMEIVGTIDDGLDVLKFLQHNRVDAIFLYINITSQHRVLLPAAEVAFFPLSSLIFCQTEQNQRDRTVFF